MFVSSRRSIQVENNATQSRIHSRSFQKRIPRDEQRSMSQTGRKANLFRDQSIPKRILFFICLRTNWDRQREKSKWFLSSLKERNEFGRKELCYWSHRKETFADSIRAETIVMHQNRSEIIDQIEKRSMSTSKDLVEMLRSNLSFIVVCLKEIHSFHSFSCADELVSKLVSF